MFEIVEIGKPGLFSRTAKIIALCDMDENKLFSDIQPGTYITKRAKFSLGETLTIKISKKSPLKVGDRLGLNALLAKSYLDDHLTYVERTPR